jgi:hypothetical protein
MSAASAHATVPENMSSIGMLKGSEASPVTYVHATSVNNAMGILNDIRKTSSGDIIVKLSTKENANIGKGRKLAFLGVPSKMTPEALQYFGNQYGTVAFHFKRPVDSFIHRGEWATDHRGVDRRWSVENSVVAILSLDEDSSAEEINHINKEYAFEDVIKGINFGQRGHDMDNIYTTKGLDKEKGYKKSTKLFLHAEVALESEGPIEMVLSHIEVIPHWYQEKHSKWRCVRTHNLAQYDKRNATNRSGSPPKACTDCISQKFCVENQYVPQDQGTFAHAAIKNILTYRKLELKVKNHTMDMFCMKCKKGTTNLCIICKHPCCTTCDYCPIQCKGKKSSGEDCRLTSDLVISEAVPIEKTGYCSRHRAPLAKCALQEQIVDATAIGTSDVKPTSVKQMKKSSNYGNISVSPTQDEPSTAVQARLPVAVVTCPGKRNCKVNADLKLIAAEPLENGGSYCKSHRKYEVPSSVQLIVNGVVTCCYDQVPCGLSSASRQVEAKPLQEGKKFCLTHASLET